MTSQNMAQKMISATVSADSKGMIELKIEMEEQSRSTKMRFTQNMTVLECLKEIWAKISQKQKDHGLFYPGDEGKGKKKPCWLENSRRLSFYGLHDQDTLVYRKKHRPLRYKLIDGTQKTLIIDDSFTVEQIVQAVAKHIGLKEDAATEFGLRRDSDKKSWLVPTHSLYEEEITPDVVLCFARQFFGLSIDQSDPFQLELMYLQSKDSILTEEYPCAKKEAIQFAALQFQITFGDHDPNKHKLGFLNLEHFLPAQWRKEKGIDQEILSAHKKLYATPTATAKYKYYQLMRTLKSFGFSMFNVQQSLQFEDKRKEGRMKYKTRPVKLAISREEIIVFSMENVIINQWDLWKLRSYQAKHTIVILDFGDHENDLIRLTTDQASKVIELIAGYIDLILKVHQDKGFTEGDDEGEEAALEDYDPAIEFGNQMAVFMQGMTPTMGVIPANQMMPTGIYPNQYPQGNPMMMNAAMGMPGGQRLNSTLVSSGMLGTAQFGGFQPKSDMVKVNDLNSAMRATRYLSDELATAKFSWKAEPNLTMANTQAQLMRDKTQLVEGIMSLLGKVKADPTALSRNSIDMQSTQLASNVKALSAGARNMRALMGEREGRPLLAGAMSVASSVADMFAVLKSVMEDPNDISSVIGMAGVEKALQNSQMLLESAKPEHFVDEGSLNLMKGCLAEVQSNLAYLYQTVETCAETLPEEDKEKMIMESKKLEARVGWLLKSAAELAPVALCEPANNELNRIRMELKDLTNRFQAKATSFMGPNNAKMPSLNNAASAVCDSLKHLLEATKTTESGGIDGIVDFATPVSILQNTLGELRTALAEPTGLVEAEKQIAAGPDVIPVAKLLEFSNLHLERAEKKREEERDKLEVELMLLQEEEKKLRAEALEPVAAPVEILPVMMEAKVAPPIPDTPPPTGFYPLPPEAAPPTIFAKRKSVRPPVKAIQSVSMGQRRRGGSVNRQLSEDALSIENPETELSSEGNRIEVEGSESDSTKSGLNDEARRAGSADDDLNGAGAGPVKWGGAVSPVGVDGNFIKSEGALISKTISDPDAKGDAGKAGGGNDGKGHGSAEDSDISENQLTEQERQRAMQLLEVAMKTAGNQKPTMERKKLMVLLEEAVKMGHNPDQKEIKQKLMNLGPMNMAPMIPIGEFHQFLVQEAKPPTTLRTDPLIKLVKDTARAGNDVTTAVKKIALASDNDTRERLKAEAILLSDNVKELVEQSRVLFKDPTNPMLVAKTGAILQKLDCVLQRLINDAGEKSAQSDLRYSAKVTVADCLLLLNQISQVSPLVSNAEALCDLQEVSKVVSSHLTDLLSEIQTASHNPTDFVKQIDLLEGARKQTGNFNMLLNKAKIAAKYVDDQSKKQELLGLVGKMTLDLGHLMQSITAVGDITGQAKIEVALEDFDAVKVDLDSAEFAAAHGELPRIPGMTRDTANELLSLASKAHTGSMNFLIQAAVNGDKLPTCISGCAATISQVANAVQAVACTIGDREIQTRILAAAQAVNVETLSMISIARVLAVDSQNPEKAQNLQKALKKFHATTASLIAAPKGFDSREINDAIDIIGNSISEMKMVDKKGVPATELELLEAANGLASTSKALSAAVAQFTTMALNEQSLGSVSKMLAATTRQMVTSCSNSSSRNHDQSEILREAALGIIEAMKDLLTASKGVAANKNPQTVGIFKSAEAAVKDAIGTAVRTLGSTSQETEEACAAIAGLIDLLQDQNYTDLQDCDKMKLINDFIKSTQNISRISASLNKAAKVSAAKVGQVSKELAYAIEDIVGTSRLAAKKAWNFTPLQSKMISAMREIKNHPMNTRKVIALAKGLTLASRTLLQNAISTCEPGSDREKKVSMALSQLLNNLNRLTVASQLAVSHQPQDIDNLVKCTETLEKQLKEVAPMINARDLDEALTPSVAEGLTRAARTICVAGTSHIRAAAALGLDENNEIMEESLTSAGKTLNEAIQDLVKACGVLNPSVRECDAAQKVTLDASNALESSLLALSLGNFNMEGVTKTLAEYQSESAQLCKGLAETITSIVEKAMNGEILPLAAATAKIQEEIPRMTKLAQLTAFTLDDSESQGDLLDLAKILTDNIANLIKSVRGAVTGDLKMAAKVSEAGASASDAVGQYLNELQSGAQIVSELESTVKTMTMQLEKLEVINPLMTAPVKRYAENRTELSTILKNVVTDARQMLTVDKNNKGEVGLAAFKLGETSAKLIDVSRQIITTTQVEESKVYIKAGTKKIVNEMSQMIRLVAETVQGQDRKDELRNSFQQVSVVIPDLIKHVKQGDLGEILIDKSVIQLGNVVQKLNTSTIFIQAGQLEVDEKEVEGMTLLNLQDKLKKASENVVQSCDSAVEACKALNSEALGKASTSVSTNAEEMATVTLHNIIKLPSITAQTELLTSVKQLTTNSQRLVLAAKEVNERPGESAANKMLVDTHHAVKINLGDIFRVMDAAGAEMLRGERVLNSVKVQIENLLVNIPGVEASTPQEVISSARVVIGATADLSFARTQDEIIAAGKKAYSGIEGVLNNSKTVAVKLSPDQVISDKIMTSSKDTARSLCHLLEASKLDRQEEATTQKLETASHTVTISINDLVAALRLLPNAENLKLEEEVEEDHNLENMAEAELRKCAEIIENAANTLLSFKPRVVPKADPAIIDESDINEAILTATKAIASATHKLVMAAEVAQTDRRQTASKGGSSTKYHADPAWANGLISAAQQVAGAVQHLVKAANDSVEGKAQEEALVSTARAVAAATAHLVSASKSKSDPNSTAIRNLSAAAKLVANATSKMVDAANKASKYKEEITQEKDDESFKGGSFGGSQVQELEIQTKIAQLERQLEQERQKLTRLRKARYAKK